MKKNFQITLWILIVGSGLLVSCHKDLDLVPLNDVTSEKVYATPDGYKQALSRVYSAYATTGNDGPAGAPDIPGGGDEGFSDFVRGFWNLQELTTDEAIIAWGDAGLPDIHNHTWSSNNGFIRRMYARCYFQITLCNEFIRECADDRLSKRGIPADARTEIEYYKQEARFLRSYQYWVLIDLFGSVPFTTEKDLVGAVLPRQASRQEIYNYIETELKDLETKLKPARSNEYGRADAAAAQALLARLYLNSTTYAGVSKNNEAVEYASKVINSGYSLGDDYQQMFAANNHLPKFSKEFIMTVNYDGLKTKGFGGTHFLVHASLGGTMKKEFAGVEGPWAGLRATKNLPLLFPDTGKNGDNGVDRRAMFYTSGQSLDISNVSSFADGFAISKYRNIALTEIGVPDSIGFTVDSIAFRIPSHGLVKGNFIKVEFASPNQLNGNYTIGYVQKDNPAVFKVKASRKLVLGSTTAFGKVHKINKGANPDQTFVDIDYPLFRLAEMYLIYAEGTLRGGTGSLTTATGYVNALRERAYGNSTGNIADADLNLDFILDERSRELYWEGHRRTDLIRYNRFVEGSYLWPFKGGVSSGAAISDFRKLFPIPVSDLTANPKLKQNPGY